MDTLNKVEFDSKDYRAGLCSHREYYTQFLTDNIIDYVLKNIGLTVISNSTDTHLNDIPLRRWDALPAIKQLIDTEKFKRLNNVTYAEHERGNFIWSLCDQICIAKTAARVIKAKKTLTK